MRTSFEYILSSFDFSGDVYDKLLDDYYVIRVENKIDQLPIVHAYVTDDTGRVITYNEKMFDSMVRSAAQWSERMEQVAKRYVLVPGMSVYDYKGHLVAQCYVADKLCPRVFRWNNVSV